MRYFRILAILGSLLFCLNDGFTFVPIRPLLPQWISNHFSALGGNFGGSFIPPNTIQQKIGEHQERSFNSLNIFANISTSNSSKFDLNQMNYTSWKGWWEEKSARNSGLIVYLVPSMLAQLLVLQHTFPLVFSRFLQYVPPEILFLSVSSLNSQVFRVVGAVLWSTVFVGVGMMFFDSLIAGLMISV